MSSSSYRVSKRQPSKSSSTDRRKNTAHIIELFGDEMPTKCSPCKKAGRVCKVHVRSGRCGACNASNDSSCDIQVTASEFRRLAKERNSLREKMSSHRGELEAARLALEAAHDRYSSALAKEGRLLKQIEQNEKRAGEAISVEERGIEEQEFEEFQTELDLPSFEPFPFDDRLLMAPVDWEELLLVPETANPRPEAVL